jgi:hypothetical protein
MCGIFRDRTKTAAVHKLGLITQRDPRREPDAIDSRFRAGGDCAESKAGGIQIVLFGAPPAVTAGREGCSEMRAAPSL